MFLLDLKITLVTEVFAMRSDRFLCRVIFNLEVILTSQLQVQLMFGSLEA